MQSIFLPARSLAIVLVFLRLAVDAKADYLLAVKEKQPTLCAEMENFFDQAHAAEWEEVPHSFYQEVEKGHGRIDIREVRVIEDLDWLPLTDGRTWSAWSKYDQRGKKLDQLQARSVGRR